MLMLLCLLPGVALQADPRSHYMIHCMGCHLQGGIAPFSMSTYEEAAMWATEMVLQVETGSMPPWHAIETAAQSSMHNRRSPVEGIRGMKTV